VLEAARRVGDGAGCAAVLVLPPPGVRAAVAVRAAPDRAGWRGRAGPGVFWDARLRVLRHAAGRRAAGLPPGRAE